MKNKLRKKGLICAIIIVLLVLALLPSINADNFRIINNLNKEDQAFLGSIYRNTGVLYIWDISPVRFTKITADGKITISDHIMGEYKKHGLLFGWNAVIVSKKGYNTFTTTVTLTKRYPDKQLFIDIKPNNINVDSPKLETNLNDYDPFNFGIVFGSTIWAKGWACGTLRFARIYARGENFQRIRFSGIFGYFILIIPLNKEITITASKLGYETETKKIILTNEKRYDSISFMLKDL